MNVSNVSNVKVCGPSNPNIMGDQPDITLHFWDQADRQSVVFRLQQAAQEAGLAGCTGAIRLIPLRTQTETGQITANDAK